MSGQNLMEIDQIVFESGLENQYAILFAGTVHTYVCAYVCTNIHTHIHTYVYVCTSLVTTRYDYNNTEVKYAEDKVSQETSR